MSIVHDIIALNKMERVFQLFWNMTPETKTTLNIEWPSQDAVDDYINERRKLDAMIQSREVPGGLSVEVSDKIEELMKRMTAFLGRLSNYIMTGDEVYDTSRHGKRINCSW